MVAHASGVADDPDGGPDDDGLLLDAKIARPCWEVCSALVHNMVTVMAPMVYLEAVMNPWMFLTFRMEFGTVVRLWMWTW